MLRVNSNQLEEIRAQFPNIPIKSTKHNIFVMVQEGSQEYNLATRVASGRASRKKRADAYWNGRRARAQQDTCTN